MIKQTIGFDGEKKFFFYTYDTHGRDMKIMLFAYTQSEAWEKFDRIYGKDHPVDMVREG